MSFDAHGSSVRPLAGAFFFGERVSWLPRQARGLSVFNGFQKLVLSREKRSDGPFDLGLSSMNNLPVNILPDMVPVLRMPTNSEKRAR